MFLTLIMTSVDHYNHELIELNRISTESMEEHKEFLSRILDEHIVETGSAWAYKIRNEFDFYSRKFWLVKPKAANLQTLLKTTKLIHNNSTTVDT